MLGKVEEMRLITECVLLDNRDAFGKLVEEYQSSLRRFLLNLTLGNVMLSEDLAQETFIKAYINLRSFRGVARFRTWLFRIAYNEYYSYIAAQKEQTSLDAASAISASPATTGVEAQLDALSCMRTLSDRERTVITLFYLEDLPIKQICRITGLNDGTVKSLLSRAKQKMKHLLEKDNYEA